MTIARASLSRRDTVLTPARDACNIWALSAFLPDITLEHFAHLISFLFRLVHGVGILLISIPIHPRGWIEDG